MCVAEKIQATVVLRWANTRLYRQLRWGVGGMPPVGKVRFTGERVRLKVTREEQGKMRQSIENKRKMRAGEMGVTVMFRDRNSFFGPNDSLFVRRGAESSLSGGLTGGFAKRSCPASLSAPLTDRVKSPEERRKRSVSSLSRSEKFSAEVPTARSAWPVSGADLNGSGADATLKTNNQNTEQRRCFAE